jgi:hypothetical protein
MIEYNGRITRKHVGKRFVSFPEKLHLILTMAPKYNVDHIISWEVHGRCFHVYSREMFVDTISTK